MSNFLCSSSIGRKLIMSISGCFLILFLLFHMSMNITAIFSAEAYDMICEFLGANWYALAATLVLGAGVAVHIFYAIWLTLQNRKARGVIRYAETVTENGVSWSSKNMLVLGFVIAGGLLLHLYNFWYNMQLVEIMGEHTNQFGLAPTQGAALIQMLFAQPLFCIIYLVWFAAIWFHLTHGVWSMFQSTGWANTTWYARLKCVSNIVATIIFLGFAAVVIVFYLRSICEACGGAC